MYPYSLWMQINVLPIKNIIFLVVYYLIFLLRNTLMEGIKDYLRNLFSNFHFYSEIDSRIVYTKCFATKSISESRYYKGCVTLAIKNIYVYFCVLLIAVCYFPHPWCSSLSLLPATVPLALTLQAICAGNTERF